MRSTAGAVLRVVSYLVIGAGLVWAIYSGNKSSPSCQNAGCVGAGIGEALLWLFTVFAVSSVAGMLNAAAFFLSKSPRSIGRKVELGLFLLPLLFSATIFVTFMV